MTDPASRHTMGNEAAVDAVMAMARERGLSHVHTALFDGYSHLISKRSHVDNLRKAMTDGTSMVAAIDAFESSALARGALGSRFGITTIKQRGSLMSKQPLPQGIQLTPLEESFRNDPYAVLAQLRVEAPVHEDTELRRFIYTRHDDVKAILRDGGFWSDPRKANPGTFSREVLGRFNMRGGEPSMLLMDEPDHRRLRSLVSGSFIPADAAVSPSARP